jgi:putative phosphoribosyl transferase
MPARTGAYADRAEAGRELAGLLARWEGRDDVVVLALPRGGVPVAAPIARALHAPLDVLVVRKLGLPGQPEVAMGALAGVGDEVELVRNDSALSRVRVPDADWRAVHDRELRELRRREDAYRAGRRAAVVSGRIVLLVDDGVATGSTMRAAVAAVSRQRPARLVVAVPVGSADTCAALHEQADEVVCGWTPQPFYAVGQVYRDFSPTEDDEVRALLAQTAPARGGAHGG